MARSYFVVVEGSPSDPDDDQVPGVYEIEIGADCPPVGIATAALDCFHGSIGISFLEDFDIKVVDENGAEVEEFDSFDGQDMEGHGTFHGKRDDLDFTAVEALMRGP